MNDAELDAMLSEIGGPCNFENMLRCFEGKMSGMCNDPDEMIINGILCHDEEGKYFTRLDYSNATPFVHLRETQLLITGHR